MTRPQTGLKPGFQTLELFPEMVNSFTGLLTWEQLLITLRYASTILTCTDEVQRREGAGHAC